MYSLVVSQSSTVHSGGPGTSSPHLAPECMFKKARTRKQEEEGRLQSRLLQITVVSFLDDAGREKPLWVFQQEEVWHREWRRQRLLEITAKFLSNLLTSHACLPSTQPAPKTCWYGVWGWSSQAPSPQRNSWEAWADGADLPELLWGWESLGVWRTRPFYFWRFDPKSYNANKYPSMLHIQCHFLIKSIKDFKYNFAFEIIWLWVAHLIYSWL